MAPSFIVGRLRQVIPTSQISARAAESLCIWPSLPVSWRTYGATETAICSQELHVLPTASTSILNSSSICDAWHASEQCLRFEHRIFATWDMVLAVESMSHQHKKTNRGLNFHSHTDSSQKERPYINRNITKLGEIDGRRCYVSISFFLLFVTLDGSL